MIVPAAAKTVFGVLLAVLVVVVWQQLDDLERRQELSARWGDLENYAVFYPRLIGNDRDEIETRGHASKIVEARDLYPVLEKAGALYVDAGSYEPGIPQDPPPPMPRPPIRVNTNYLKKYPILDSSGSPINVADHEQAWVVAIPEKFKSREAELRKFLRATRTGGAGFEGAVQAQERMLREPVPQQFTRQEVRIIWTASEQKVFSFNSKVSPDTGNMIVDPVIEIMTPANSMTVDRLNAITGGMNPSLKVHVEGDPAATLREITPLLKKLNLDDNLQHLVTPQEAMLTEVSDIRSGLSWVAAFAVGSLLVMLVLNVTMVVIGSDRLQRRIIVRRLHGIGFTRAYRELLTILGGTWLGQAVLAVAVGMLLGMRSSSPPGVGATMFAQVPRVLAVLVVSLLIEALFVIVTAGIVERRNAVKRLKEL
ncbi:hypothetical protein [Streptoalloteichus tenebrarius]|uniref:hypothetical protein n=1 Tax=Streptoalloteichus tenebrarius (strain ATCC 17920 / DSM 40477 / JCM 4838 / CBS 697.72 / NBRC 16177 / NCIMB 11028 / NRRL B-12390 / A12253. 1 / ISP 5477) TaxID=1933 RepID=UPI0020A5E7EE|nr:hypothetical protein [Streptoalloteichus tenebrarius]BFF03712.1 hypothetical protein GCM10020241_53870 [Streptoalloteichus tenebrarius]